MLFSFSFSKTGYVQCPSFDIGYMRYTNQQSFIIAGKGFDMLEWTFMECVHQCEIMQQDNSDVSSVEFKHQLGSCSCHKRSSRIEKFNQYSVGPWASLPETVACYLQRKSFLLLLFILVNI